MTSLPFRVALGALLVGCVSLPHGDAPPGTLAVRATVIPLDRTNPARQRVGRLVYMGGLHLRADDDRFGGLSGLRWRNGRLFAVSDAGDWFAIDPREADGRLVGIDAVRVQRLADTSGHPLQGKSAGDAEALDMQDTGSPASAVVAFEQDHRLWRYPIRDGLPAGPAQALPVVPQWLRTLPANGGIEAMASGGGLRLLVSESARTPSGAAQAMVEWQGRWQAMPWPVVAPFSPTDVDHLEGRRFVALYRRYSLMAGVGARIEEMEIATMPDGTIEARPVLVAELAPPLNVDNMEGLAAREEGGRTFLYIVSDDNFSGAQRTLLMKFELVGTTGR